MEMHLVVAKPFGGLKQGDGLTDPARVPCIFTDDYDHSVARMAARMPGGVG
jgi:hypothetical protein